MEWKSYYVKPKTQEQLKALKSIIHELDVDILSHPILEREGVVLVEPEHQVEFTKILEERGIAYGIHSPDIKVTLDHDDNLIQARKHTLARHKKELPYYDYQELEIIDAYLVDIANHYPDKVTLVSPANSFEGHPIQYLKISTTDFKNASKPVIIIDSGIHAREWISPPTVTWAIHKLVEDVTEPDLLERFDWILLPVVNPDGYRCTFNNARFWRKTRSTDQNTLSNICPGVDGNRNYDFFWNTVGTEDNPCTNTYAGGQPFSEIETRVIRDLLHEHLNRTALYLTMHSYGSMILYPWGNDGTRSNNSCNLYSVAEAMADKIDANSLSFFPKYAFGNSAMVIGYETAGSSDDYAHSIGIPLAYTIELPGFGNSLEGFHLDPMYIEQVCSETWEGFVAGARLAGELFAQQNLI
ncbi:carboxypeptidase B-like [Aphomia sociella]